MVSIVLNGEQREIPDELALDKFLEHFELPLQRVAVEVNREVIRRALWPDTIIKDADKIEVVHFVGGG
ncbi:MAG TPA: sulfur carrier protein ThiS [Pyrinomonadaceae bacterium]|nr:sulfur carrier protein ThiS [Pyrinomonadaceae bacterium]